MDTPPSRYRVIEQDRRLIVVDTQAAPSAAAEPARSAAAPAPVPGISPKPRGFDAPAPAGFLSGALHRLDGLALFLAGLATRRDAQGRAVVDWSGGKKGRRWHAWLDARQELALGRVLLGFAAAAGCAALALFGGAELLFVPAVVLVLVSWPAYLLLRARTAKQTPAP